MPVSNCYQAYNADGTTDPAASFAYWTDPIFDTAQDAERRATTPTRRWCTRPPRPRPPPRPPTPGTDDPGAVGAVHPGRLRRRRRRHGEQELENTAVDIPKVFGAEFAGGAAARRGPRLVQGRRDRRLRRARGALRAGQRVLRQRAGVKFGQTGPSPTAAPTCCRTSRAATPGTRRLFGHRYVAPQLGAGTAEPDPQRLSGDQRRREPGGPEREPDQRGVPGQPSGLPRLQRHQRLADARPTWPTCWSAGVPVVNGYISDIHGNEDIPGLSACAARPGRARQRQRRATSPRRSTTTRRSGCSSSGWPPTGSRRRTRCSSSAPTRVTTRRGQRRPGDPAHPGEL